MSKKSGKKSRATVTATVAVRAAQRSPPKPRQSAKRPAAPAWLNAVRNPWAHAPTSVPDELCQPSLKYESRFSELIPASDLAAVPGTQHGVLIGVGPYLFPTVLDGAGAISYRGYDGTANVFSGPCNIFTMPNSAAMFPPVPTGTGQTSTGYSFRVTAMSAKLSYTGTELNRAGRIFAGLASPSESANSLPATAVNVNPLNMVFGGTYVSPATQQVQQVRNRMRRIATMRNPDGSVQVNWLPTGVPRYASMLQSTAGIINEYAENLGPIILFGVTGDTTQSASAAGGLYALDVVMHIEALPLSRYALAIGPTPSPYDTTALAACLNAFEQMSAVSEWDASGHHNQDDGGQGAPGSAWELISSVGNNVYSGVQATMGGLETIARNPFGRAAIHYGINRARSRRQGAPMIMY